MPSKREKPFTMNKFLKGITMSKNILIIIIFQFTFSQVSFATNSNKNTTSQIIEIFLLNKLEEDRYFCLDIRGYKTRAIVSKGLQAHTCYSYEGNIAVDQGFDRDLLGIGKFRVSAFNSCMQRKNVKIPSPLALVPCDNKKLQKFFLSPEGLIQPEDQTNLCVTAASGKARKGRGGSPIHQIRRLRLDYCKTELRSYQSWGIRVSE